MRKTSSSNMSYGKIAKIYDSLEIVNYFGLARKTRNWFIGNYGYRPKNVLIAACGTGEFARALAIHENPPCITLNDIAENMLNIAQYKLAHCQWEGQLEVSSSDILSLRFAEKFDLIVVNYFLSMFSPLARVGLIQNISNLLTDDGTIQVADYARPENHLMLPFFYLNWTISVIFFWVLSGTKPNILGNMEQNYKDAGLKITKKKTFIGGLYATYLLKKAERAKERSAKNCFVRRDGINPHREDSTKAR